MKQLAKIFLSVLIYLTIFGNNLAIAEEPYSSMSGITVLPAKFELWATRGQTLNQSLQIINNSDFDYIYALSADNISTTGENGEVEIGGSNPNLSNLLSSWILTDQINGTLQAHSTKNINIQIKIPSDIDIGGKYASIVISLDKAIREPGDSAAVARIVSLVMVTIAGDFSENAQILNFDLNQNKKSSEFIARIRNQGAAHIKPDGLITVTNLFGQKIAEIPFEGDNVLPGSVRKSSANWEPGKFLFGFYKAQLKANYGQKNDSSIEASKSFWVWPEPFTIILLIMLAVAVLLGCWRIIYNRR